MKPLLLIADSSESDIRRLSEVLEGGYRILTAKDGAAAVKMAQQKRPDLIILDAMLPDPDGYQICRELKKNIRTKLIPVIFLSPLADDLSELSALELGAVDYITKPFNPALVKARVKNHLLTKEYQDLLEDLLEQRTYHLIKTQEVTIKSLGTLAEYRDPETGGHIKRTQSYVQLLATELQSHPEYGPELSDDVIQALYHSAPLHDIGKVGVPDHILLKPGRLLPKEFEEMKQHALYGWNAIISTENELGDESTFLSHARDMAYTHHERWDRMGYPRGLREREIPLSGRIMAVADVYDALISRRVYKPPFSHTFAVSSIQKGSGTHFDPTIVDTFSGVQEQFRQIAIEFADSEEELAVLVN